MPSELKRKSSPTDADGEVGPAKRVLVEQPQSPESATQEPVDNDANDQPQEQPEEQAFEPTPVEDTTSKPESRVERFKALQARQSQSRNQNRKETAAEAQRLSTDPNLLSSLNRKRAIASHKLLKADAEAAGEDFERKRAWDWTVEESEKWDRRMEKKEKHREDVAFQDYRQDARKVYKRQVRELKPDMEAYENEKAEAVRRAAENGGLEIVETEDGELVAIDKEGTFYSTANSTTFAENKPNKARVDALVNDLRKAEEVRLRKRKERGRAEDEGDVTYINEKNKQFNQKLSRFYNKYTADIRDSFERGTAI